MPSYTARGELRSKTVPQPPKTGAGTELKRMLALALIYPDGTCGCNSMAARMDLNGTQWCRDNIEEILDHLKLAAANRKLPFLRYPARFMVELAISRAESKEGK